MTLQIIPAAARVISLCRVAGDQLKMTEGAEFDGCEPIELALRRASVSGLVAFNSEIGDYWADVGTQTGNHLLCVSLDRNSFKALKEQWLKVKYLYPEGQ